MAHADDLIRLRTRALEGLKIGFYKDEAEKALSEGTLIQVLNEAERKRQACITQAEHHRIQMAQQQAQAEAFGMVGSMLYSVLDGYIRGEERRVQEERDRAAERAAQQAEAEREALLTEAAAIAEYMEPAERESPHGNVGQPTDSGDAPIPKKRGRPAKVPLE